MEMYSYLITNKSVGSFIRSKRKELGISGKELGVMLNVSQQQISRYENGNTNISIDLLNKLLMLLNVSWEEFILKKNKNGI